MAKVLKTAAIVVGAVALGVATLGVGSALAAGFSLSAAIGTAAATTVAGIGISAGALAGIAAAGLVGASLLQGAPKPSGGGSQTKWKADPYAGLPYVMGRTLIAGNIVARRGSGGNNTYEHFVTILSICMLTSIDTTYMNKTTVAFNAATGRASGTYQDRIWQKTQLGASPEPAALTPGAGTFPGWTSAHKLSGMAATLLTMEYDSKGKTTFTTEPTPAWIVHGVKVWDPRQDSTYPGGSGACRAYDESSYVYSEDPHLHGLTWALGRYQNGRRVAGIGTGATVPGGVVKSIDVASFVEGANLNDARGWKLGGQVVTRPDTPWNSLKAMLQAGGAMPVINRGVISCINRAPRVSLATITRSDIVGSCSFSGTQRKRARINGIVPSYRSEAHDWEMVPAAAVSVADYVALDGGERTKEQAYPLVQDVHQVTQLATYDVCDAREAGPGTVPLKPWWLNYRVGDCVTFSPEAGFSIKVIVTSRGLEPSTGVVSYGLISETDAKHDFALGKTGTAPPTASFSYDSGVPAPGLDEWTLTGTALTDGGASIPALHLSGAVANGSAEAMIVEYRVAGSTTWNAAGIEPPTTTDKVITSITPGTSYEVAVSYRVRGGVSDRLVLGPVTAGQLLAAGQTSVAIRTAYYTTIGAPLTASTSSTITVAAQTWDYTVAGGEVMRSGGTISGLSASTTYYVYFDDPTLTNTAPTFYATTNYLDGLNSSANPYRHALGSITTPASGGGGGSSSGGGGGGGYGGGRLQPY